MFEIIASYFTLTNMLLFLLALPIVYYLYLTRNHGKYEAKGLKSIKPELFHGNRGPMTRGEMSMAEYYQMLYDQFKGER